MEADRKVRYAIVGLGDIAQEDMMPGVEHTGNSEITALVTSDAVKAAELGKKYGVNAVFSYDQSNEALGSGTFDAMYLATPNWRHAEFIIPAATSSGFIEQVYLLSSVTLAICRKHGARDGY